ncbi:uncharacterized protein MYCFIDRAFT_140225 [Pseudocercospora fijiensis CIRAD86]|uniref:Uncharacterized protein n=1 Tax=Pseudocercospora fijiensis (strain CIRAD86) TaxID=383855 RepID=M3AVJ4_PSEFD|nr:uncharacterized protein MYCFIDRAFT_140225 [Pseudocercospora fijiensis CIRAD86]EME81502.1 hypothetical protein MYCFIDRAFT_140225 [Pseudocercospora fijiensis CIRAD86]
MEGQKTDVDYLRGIVDMGSNGIRFSISSLQPPTERIMPTLYQHRVGISLYDAQYQGNARVPIDDKTIAAVIAAFKQFRRTCNDFGVHDRYITVLATEATRTAINSEDFRKQIKTHLDWDVSMLPKEEEGRVGAMGVASSLPALGGLVMDLGGGSTQLSWIIKNSASNGVRLPEPGAVSMPYGAAAMSRRLAEAEDAGNIAALKKEITDAVRAAYASLKVPIELEQIANSQGGFTLYLSGGGFRGWGYVLMSQHPVSPYPIPVINGFKASRNEFLSTDQVKAAAAESLEHTEDGDVFRISERRAGQVPAVAFLVNALAEALPHIKEVRFCQGGVREGYLFSSISAEAKSEQPLVVATRHVAKSITTDALVNLLQDSLPPAASTGSIDDYKSVFIPELLEAFANLMYYHSSHSKDLQSSAALRISTAGVLAGVHGITHEARALIALLLCARWGASIPPSDEQFKRNLEQLVDAPWTLWWINYLGAVASLIASIYPAGIVRKERLALKARWASDDKNRRVLALKAIVSNEADQEAFDLDAHAIEKTGKRKRWIGGRDGIGHRVNVEVTRRSA